MSPRRPIQLNLAVVLRGSMEHAYACCCRGKQGKVFLERLSGERELQGFTIRENNVEQGDNTCETINHGSIRFIASTSHNFFLRAYSGSEINLDPVSRSSEFPPLVIRTKFFSNGRIHKFPRELRSTNKKTTLLNYQRYKSFAFRSNTLSARLSFHLGARESYLHTRVTAAPFS